MSDLDIPETTYDTPRPNRTNKNDQVQDLSNDSENNTSVSPDRGGDDEDINGTRDEQNQGEVTLPRDEIDTLKKRKVSPQHILPGRNRETP
jgi:hypothetical protein